MPLVAVQSFLLSLLEDLSMPYGQPNAQAAITPPDPRIQARIPAIYIWPADGDENRSSQLGGTVPRNTGPGTASGTKGILHLMDVYLTWFSANNRQGQDGGPVSADPVFPGMIDAVMFALRFSQPNPAVITDPSTNISSTIYNVGENMKYRTGIEATADQRWLRYDCLITCEVWEIFNA
jgi:hypothetical protein